MSTTKTLRETRCVVTYLHLANTLLSGYYTQNNKSQTSRYLLLFKLKIVFIFWFEKYVVF